MTIKQQGGIFGRNPTFNEVTVGNDIAKLTQNGVNAYLDTEKFQIRAPDGSLVGLQYNPDDSGRIQLRYAGNLKIQTTGTGVSVTGNVAVSDGGGIDFSATSGTGTSELFDDYEEGTWTPTVATDGADGTYTVTVNTATYTKVGNSVRVSFYVTVAVTVVPTGAVSIGGLPFNAAEDTAFSNALDTLTASTGNGYLLAGSPIMRFTEAGSASWKDMVAGAVTKYVMVSAVYRSA
jgi:hypothetical protein